MKKWYVLVSLFMVFTMQGMDRQLRRSEESPLDTVSVELFSRQSEVAQSSVASCGQVLPEQKDIESHASDFCVVSVEKFLQSIKHKEICDEAFEKMHARQKTGEKQVDQVETKVPAPTILEALKEPDVYGSLVGLGLYAAKYYECIPDKVFFPTAAAVHGLIAWHQLQGLDLARLDSRKCFGAFNVGLSLGCLYKSLSEN